MSRFGDIKQIIYLGWPYHMLMSSIMGRWPDSSQVFAVARPIVHVSNSNINLVEFWFRRR